jgi:hypothetical protein
MVGNKNNLSEIVLKQFNYKKESNIHESYYVKKDICIHYLDFNHIVIYTKPNSDIDVYKLCYIINTNDYNDIEFKKILEKKIKMSERQFKLKRIIE